jgi:hypothetical protein
MFVLVEKHSRLLGGSRPPAKPGDVWDDMSGTVHACNPHGRSHTFCGRLIVGESRGWFVGEDTDEIARVTCRTCHTILWKQDQEAEDEGLSWAAAGEAAQHPKERW